MDVLKFVNSKDIREHLKNIGYQFSSLEAAWLIYQCRNATIKEKHQAWKELIRTMPDCSIAKRCNTEPQESLHVFLNEYMKIEDELIQEFCEEHHTDTWAENKTYVFRFKYEHDDGTSDNSSTVFSNYDTLIENVREPEEDVTLIYVYKMQVDVLSCGSMAIIDRDHNFLKLYPGEIEDKHKDEIYKGVFDGFWFEFPTPFRKGDIIWDPKWSEDGICSGPFVNRGVCLDGIESKRTIDNLRNNADNTDMCAGGYFVSEDGSIYSECMSNYMDLEYYEKELSGPKRTLIAVSNFMKEEIDLSLYARAYHQIITSGYAESSMPWDILDSGLILAGLKKESSMERES